MKYTTIIFSPTGGTKKAAKALTAAWGEAAATVDLTKMDKDFAQVALTSEDVAVIAVPSYGGRMPDLAAERMAALHGNGARAVLVCVYGNRAYEDTLVEMEDLAKQAGFIVVAAVAVIAEHSILRQFAAGRPDTEDQEVLTGYAQKILNKLQAGGAGMPAIPGTRPYKKVNGVGMVPRTGTSCTKCGLCAAECPAGAIDKDNIKSVDKAKCISCMRCVTICPQNAKSVSALMLSGASAMLKKACSGRKECELYL